MQGHYCYKFSNFVLTGGGGGCWSAAGPPGWGAAETKGRRKKKRRGGEEGRPKRESSKAHWPPRMRLGCYQKGLAGGWRGGAWGERTLPPLDLLEAERR